MEIKSEEVIPWPVVKNILEKRAAERALGYEQKNAFEHLKKFSKLSQKKMEEMRAELTEISKLKERQISLIINFLPEDEDALRILLSSEVVNLTSDDKKKIISIVKKHI